MLIEKNEATFSTEIRLPNHPANSFAFFINDKEGKRMLFRISKNEKGYLVSFKFKNFYLEKPTIESAFLAGKVYLCATEEFSRFAYSIMNVDPNLEDVEKKLFGYIKAY